MAKIEFKEGVQCQQCGHMVDDITIYTPELCQKCGAHIINANVTDKSYDVGPQGKSIVIKVTHKWFSRTCEFVREI